MCKVVCGKFINILLGKILIHVQVLGKECINVSILTQSLEYIVMLVALQIERSECCQAQSNPLSVWIQLGWAGINFIVAESSQTPTHP